MKSNLRLGGRLLTAGAAMLWAGSALASQGGGKFLGADFSYNGFIRVDTAINTSAGMQEANQFGDLANGIPVDRVPGNPATGWTTPLAPAVTAGTLTPAVAQLISAGQGVLTGNGGGATLGVSNLVGVNDTITRYVPRRNNLLNYHLFRLELTPTLSWGNWSLLTHIRAVYDPGGFGYEDFNYQDYKNLNGGIQGGTAREYHSTPDYLGYAVDGSKHPVIFEQSGRNYMIDLPAFFLQWTNGNLTVRVGNQTVAWGQLLFFRIFDVANGLDFRRHLILNRAVEEYADVRESAPGIRLTWQANDQIVVDAFAQQFIPTILNNTNTPYNLVPTQFTLHDRYVQGGYNKKLNMGVRVTGNYGDFSFEAMYTHRYNPLGAIRWTKSGVNNALPNSNLLGAGFNQLCPAITTSYNAQYGTNLPTNNGCGGLLSQTPFEAAPAAVMSAYEWYNYAGYIKLDPIDGLNAAINDFPAAQALTAQPVGRNPDAAANELDAFFSAAEGLRGHIERRYFSENIFGAGLGYVTSAEPGSLFDQLIMHVEATYTPRRIYTAIDLNKGFHAQQNTTIGFVAEKYQRFSQSFPATYMVFQYLWEQNEDLAGLLLHGYGSENYARDTDMVKLNPHVPTSQNPNIAPGLGAMGANYVVFAALQPFPAYIYELSFATLIDVQGGILFQPGFVWKPRGDITVNLFYNYVNDNVWGNNPNKNIVRLFNHTNEAVIRLGYQF